MDYPFFACYIGLFVRPVITTWYRVKDIYNIEVWTGFDDYSICLEPDNYVGTLSYCIDIFGTAVFMRNHSTLLAILRQR